MKVIGIVGEYNPFHNGHAFHIQQSRDYAGNDCAIICIMSGNFVQRGDVAVFNKHARAAAAVECGADLVFELPIPWTLSSAEGFARGAVGLLGQLGVVTHLSFGSESGSIDALSTVAQALLDPAMHEKIKDELKEPVPYAAARQRALEKEVGAMAKLIETPNNILAVEYLKAIFDQRLKITPMTVLRSGAGHDQLSDSGVFRSAADVRAMLGADMGIESHVPETAYSVYKREIKAGRGPVMTSDLEQGILSRLRMLREEDFASVPGASEGLNNRLARAAWSQPTIDAVLGAAKTKRYALSRLRRMIICAALGVSAKLAQGIPPYARLLAVGVQGRSLLRDISEKAKIPVLTKPASIKELGYEERTIFDVEARAGDLYVLGYPARQERHAGYDWVTSPIVLGGK